MTPDELLIDALFVDCRVLEDRLVSATQDLDVRLLASEALTALHVVTDERDVLRHSVRELRKQIRDLMSVAVEQDRAVSLSGSSIQTRITRSRPRKSDATLRNIRGRTGDHGPPGDRPIGFLFTGYP